MGKLLSAERRMMIASLVNKNGSVHIKDLSNQFDVSTETIRRDLIILNDKGIIQKSRGGAIALNENYERPIKDRTTENFELKERIAKKALDFIETNNVIIIDSGSTLLAFAQIFPKRKEITLITNSFAAANVLSGNGNNIVFIGGELSEITMSTSGMLTTHSLNLIKADIAFLGSSGFQSHSGPCAKIFHDAQTKIDMVRNSNRRIVLADSSKFSQNAIVQYADWSDIDILITDKNAPSDMVRIIKETTKVVFA